MGIFKTLFGSNKVSVEELRAALSALERERRRKTLRVQKLERRRADLLGRIRDARVSGRNIEVDYLWEELKQLNVEAALEYREAKITNLEVLGLKRYVFGLERLQAARDENGIRRLVERIRGSGLDDKLSAQTIRDDEYLRELELTLEESGLGSSLSIPSESDPEKAAFLSEIDAINASEERGEPEDARRREDELKRRFREDAERGGAE